MYLLFLVVVVLGFRLGFAVVFHLWLLCLFPVVVVVVVVVVVGFRFRNLIGYRY